MGWVGEIYGYFVLNFAVKLYRLEKLTDLDTFHFEFAVELYRLETQDLVTMCLLE